MRILYIHQYFATPKGSTGTRSYEFARRWVRAGHHVTILTTSAQLTAADLAGGKRWRWHTEFSVDGIKVLALNIPYRQAMGFSRRVLAFLSYMVLAGGYVLFGRRFDIVYASSTPITVGVPALFGRWLRRVPFVFEVRDPWPALPIAMGVIRHPLLVWLLNRLEKVIYRSAEAIVALSPGMQSLVEKVAPAGKKVVSIPNAADTDFFRPEVDGRELRNKLNWDGRFVCVHAGAMGRVNGLDIILRAANHFREERDWLFALIGDGREKDALCAEQRRLRLDNLRVLDGVPKHELPAFLAAADLCLMTVMPLPLLEHNSANKFFDYLSAGRPILLNYGGWQQELLEAARAGYGCRLGDDADFFAKLKIMRSDSARCLEMPRNARKLAMEQFNRDRLAAQALEVIARVRV